VRPLQLRNVTGPTIAHRGLFSEERPENSLEAIVFACHHNHWSEFDVRLSKDGQVVVFHDDNLDRMCGNSEDVSELRASDLTSNFLKSSACKIPLFQSLLESVPPNATLVVELKSFSKKQGFSTDGLLEKEVLKSLSHFKGRALLKSFNPYSVHCLLQMTQSHSVGLLACDYFKDGDFPFADKAVGLALKELEIDVAREADFISYSVNDLTPELSEKVRNIRQQGLMVWTVRTPEHEMKARKLSDNFVFEQWSTGPDKPL
jgi:glycerophosphoryl diester phosphodiesterase